MIPTHHSSAFQFELDIFTTWVVLLVIASVGETGGMRGIDCETSFLIYT